MMSRARAISALFLLAVQAGLLIWLRLAAHP